MPERSTRISLSSAAAFACRIAPYKTAREQPPAIGANLTGQPSGPSTTLSRRQDPACSEVAPAQRSLDAPVLHGSMLTKTPSRTRKSDWPLHASPFGSSPLDRDQRVDTVRGVLLLMMAVNHIDSDLRFFTDQPFGFVSSAEGFVFLSGLVAGQAYTRRLYDSGPQGMASACLARARQVFAWHAALAVWTVLWCQVAIQVIGHGPGRLPWLFSDHPVQGLIAALALLYQPGLLDILPNYIGFLLLTPVALRCCARGKWWLLWMASAVIWAADQVFAPPEPIVYGVINTGAFHFLSWQWLFVSGLVLGYARTTGVKLFQKSSYIWVTVAACVAIALWVLHSPGFANGWTHDPLGRLVSKTSFAPVRSANFAVVAFLLAFACSRFPRWFQARPLAFLGRYTLPAFGAHILGAMVVLTWPESFDEPWSRAFGTFFVILCLIIGAIAGHLARVVKTRSRRSV